jgi:serine/threonine-protein kinase
VLLFELFSGRRPFSGDTQDVLRRTVHEPMPMQALRGRAPRHLISLIEQATSKAPDDRPPDFDQIVLALDRRPRRHAMVGAVVLAAAAVAVVLVGIATFRGSDGTPVASARTGAERAPAATGDSIAVLPFQTAGQDSDVAYVADGLVESVTNTLTRIRTVRVIASATAFGYRGRTDVQAIGRALNVRTLVMGRLSRIRDSFRVQAELVDTGSGTQLWGQQYQGSEDDLLQFHDDLALRVSQHLRSDTSHAEEPPWRSTQNPRAFQLYLKGRYSLAQASVPEIQKAIGLFHQALEVDPVYAVAYSGLADSYIGLSGNFLTPKDAMSKAKAAALRALDLDPNVPEAHISLGIVRGYFDFDWAASTDSFKRAITLQPTNASSHLWYAWNLLLTGDANEALDQAQRAQELDPLSAYIEVGAGQMHYYAGRTDAAVQRLERAVQSRPDLFIGRYYLGVAYLQANRLADAVRELESARRLDPQQPQPLGYLAFAYAQNGDRERAGQRLEQLQRLAASRYVSDYLFAIAAAGMGARDEVVRRLERAYEQHDDMLSVLGVDRPFTVLRTDPRVRALIFRLGIA